MLPFCVRINILMQTDVISQIDSVASSDISQCGMLQRRDFSTTNMHMATVDSGYTCLAAILQRSRYNAAMQAHPCCIMSDAQDRTKSAIDSVVSHLGPRRGIVSEPEFTKWLLRGLGCGSAGGSRFMPSTEWHIVLLVCSSSLEA